MATVYPENTTYQTAGGGESVSARFPSLLKDIKSKIQNQSIQSVEQQRQRLARAATMFQPPQSGTSLRTDVASGSLTPPLSTQLAEGSKTETPIPSNYSGFYTGDSPESMTGVFPSDEAYIRSLPTSAGGGEYVVDPTQRGQLIKSIRGKDNAADILIRGGLSPLLYQIDHIVPLWAGGADTISNRQVIDVDTHRKKTRAQSVAYTLLANNKIGLNEAKQLALSWDTRDTSHIQDPDDNGFVDLRAAEDAYTRWKKETGPKPVTIRDIVKGIPAAMQKFGEGWLPGPIREFVKGGVSGLTAGWVPYEKAEYKPGVESTLSTIGGAAGQVAGTIYSFMKFAKLATKAASMAKNVGIKWLGRAPSASLATDIGTASIENVKRLANKERIGRILRDAGLFTVYGQLSRQEENTIESRMKRFFFDTAYGGMLGGAAKSISGYSTVAAGTFSLSLIEGEDAEDAALNAAIMTGLHGLGGTRAKKIEERLDEETSKAARGVLNKYLGDRIPTIKKGERYTDIDITPAEAETLYAQALNQLGKTYLSTNLSLEDLAKERAKIIVSLRQLVNRNLPPAERTKRATEDLQTTIGLLNSEVDALGYRTPPVLSKLLDDVPLRFPAQPVSTSVATPGETYAKGVIPVTGLAKDTVGESVTQNLIRFVDSVKAGTASNRVILVSRPEIEPIIRGVNNTMPEKDIKELRHRPSANPQNNVQVFAMLESPRGREYLPIGWLSRRFRIEDASTSFNKNFEKMVARIREKIKSNKSDPVKLQDELRKDKARIDIDEMDIPRVVEAATTMDDDALIAFLRPKSALIRFDSGFNKDTIAEEMRRKNLPFVTADIPADPPRWFETKAPESGEPVLVVNIEDKNWIETMELMKGGVKASAESRQIQGLLPASIRERQTSQNITATIKNIKNSFREDADVILANTEIPKMGPEKGIVEGMLSGFKNDLLTSKTPQEFKERINKIYGEVLDDTEASELLNNKESVRVKDVFNLLTDAHNAGKTNETFNVLHQKMLVDFFENRYFARSRLSGDFLEAPLISQKAVQQPLPSPVSTRTSVTRSPKVTTSKLEGLTPSEQAGVEQARQTGGLFMTAKPSPKPIESTPTPTQTPTQVPLAERISKSAVIRTQPSKATPPKTRPEIQAKQPTLPIIQPSIPSRSSDFSPSETIQKRMGLATAQEVPMAASPKSTTPVSGDQPAITPPTSRLELSKQYDTYLKQLESTRPQTKEDLEVREKFEAVSRALLARKGERPREVVEEDKALQKIEAKRKSFEESFEEQGRKGPPAGGAGEEQAYAEDLSNFAKEARSEMLTKSIPFGEKIAKLDDAITIAQVEGKPVKDLIEQRIKQQSLREEAIQPYIEELTRIQNLSTRAPLPYAIAGRALEESSKIGIPGEKKPTFWTITAEEKAEEMNALKILGYSPKEINDIVSKKQTLFVRPVYDTVKDNIKKSEYPSYKRGFNETFDYMLSQAFGKNWGDSWVLNPYFSSFTKKGKGFQEYLFNQYNENLHYRSMTKKFLEGLVVARKKTAGGKYELPPEEKAKIAAVLAERRAELDAAEEVRLASFANTAASGDSGYERSLARQALESELGRRVQMEDIVSKGMRIKDPTQVEGVLEDLTKFEELLKGILYQEIIPGIKLNSVDGAHDARSVASTLFKEVNFHRKGTEKPFVSARAEPIIKKIEKETAEALAKELETSTQIKEANKEPALPGSIEDIRQYKNLLKSRYKSE